MDNNSSKQILLSVLGVAILVVAVVGVSFAAFSATKTGTVENKITTGTVTLTYTEGKNGISITDAMPMSDDDGKAIVATATNVFDFQVSAVISGKTTINYAISAVKVPETEHQLEETYAKLWLEEIDALDDTHTGTTKNANIMEPKTYATDAADEQTGKPVSEMTLYKGTFTKTEDRYYRLRMWVDENYTVTDEKKSFTVKVNVYAKAAAQ